MSTPETDAFAERDDVPACVKWSGFARMLERQRNEWRDGTIGLMKLLAEIRAAVGDPDGRLMQDELVEHCRNLLSERDALKARMAELETQWTKEALISAKWRGLYDAERAQKGEAMNYREHVICRNGRRG